MRSRLISNVNFGSKPGSRLTDHVIWGGSLSLSKPPSLSPPVNEDEPTFRDCKI